MRPATAALPLSDGQREVLETLVKSRIAAHRDVQRAQALLLAADGAANTQIAATVAASPTSVKAWRERFASEGLTTFRGIRPGRGRKPPRRSPRSSGRPSMRHRRVRRTGVVARWQRPRASRPATVQRIWAARGLKPHLVKTFKLSNDKRFEETLVDVVGLYLNPPENAVVRCMDEKSQIQALDRTQASLPIRRGRAATMTHD